MLKVLKTVVAQLVVSEGEKDTIIHGTFCQEVLVAFCSCSGNLSKVEFNGNDLICLCGGNFKTG